jgi:hypothetical protein
LPSDETDRESRKEAEQRADRNHGNDVGKRKSHPESGCNQPSLNVIDEEGADGC